MGKEKNKNAIKQEEKKKTSDKRDRERKDQELHMRMTKTQMNLLDILSYENDKTKTDMVVKAIEFYYNYNKKGFF